MNTKQLDDRMQDIKYKLALKELEMEFEDKKKAKAKKIEENKEFQLNLITGATLGTVVLGMACSVGVVPISALAIGSTMKIVGLGVLAMPISILITDQFTNDSVVTEREVDKHLSNSKFAPMFNVTKKNNPK